MDKAQRYELIKQANEKYLRLKAFKKKLQKRKGYSDVGRKPKKYLGDDDSFRAEYMGGNTEEITIKVAGVDDIYVNTTKYDNDWN